MLVFGGVALTYDLLFGFTGLLSFGHALYFALGVYLTAIGTTKWGWPLWQTLLVTALAGLLLPVVLGSISLRVGGIAFAMVTLAFAEAGSIVVDNNPRGLTGAEEGVTVDFEALPSGLVGVINTDNLYWLALAYVVVVFVVVNWVVDSSPGRVMQAIRENERRVEVLGLQPFRFKLFAFVLASFLATAGGVVYALILQTATPSVTTPAFTLSLLLMVVIGGTGTRWGAILGGALYTFLDNRLPTWTGSETIQDLPSVISTPLSEPLFVLGTLFILIVFFLPGRARGAAHAAPTARPALPRAEPRRRPRRARAGCGHGRRRGGEGVIVEQAIADSAGVRIAYDVTGSGPPLVLVHGLGYARWGWQPVAPALAESFTRPHARQPRHRRERRRRPARTRQERWRRTSSPSSTPPASTARTSSGRASAAWSRRRSRSGWPERVDRLVLACTTPGGEGAFPLPERTLRLLAEAPALAPEVALRRFVENALADRTVAERPELVQRIYEKRLEFPPDPSGWQAQAAAGASHDAFSRLQEIHAPTLVLHGTDDGVVDPRNAELLERELPDARRVMFEGAGHLFFWEEPERFVEVVRDFLAGPHERPTEGWPLSGAHVIGRWIRDRGRNTPDRIAIDHLGRRVTYARAGRAVGAAGRLVARRRAAPGRPGGDAHGEHSRARRGALRLRQGRTHAAAALVAALAARARLPARRLRSRRSCSSRRSTTRSRTMRWRRPP